MEPRLFIRATKRLKPSLCHVQNRLASSSSTASTSKPSNHQANPIGDYYASILESSTSNVANAPPTSTKPRSAPAIETKSVDSEPDTSILFSSRLSSPLERRSEIKKKSVLIAGVWVPPRPDEPDNCCMSGCVNCVWDRYGDEVEEWATAKREASAALQKQKASTTEEKQKKGILASTGTMLGDGEKGAEHTMVSMDDDGGGSETNWGGGLETGFTNDDLFKSVPVGIREFMKQEKRLKEKHAKERTGVSSPP